MADWSSLPTDILVLIAKHIEFFEDLCNFYEVCKSWHSVTSILGLPSRFPWVMLTDKAEINFPPKTEGLSSGKMIYLEVQKNEQIEGMHNRQFYSFLASKPYEFNLPEATRKKCLGVGYGLLLTLGYDLQINILNPFTRQQIGLPDIYSFDTKFYIGEELSPHKYVKVFFGKAAMSSNPFRNEDSIIMAIYGEHQYLAFTRPGDKGWTDVLDVDKYMHYQDVVFYKGNFYAVHWTGYIVVCDINDANHPKAIRIAYGPDHDHYNFKYLVESSGDLLLVIRYREGPYYDDEEDIARPYNYTVGFSIFKLEECAKKRKKKKRYPYKFTEVKDLGNMALFIGNNASVSVPSSLCVKANSIYFSDNDVLANGMLPYGGGYDTGIYDVESGNITLHYASKFMSHLTPPTWIIP